MLAYKRVGAVPAGVVEAFVQASLALGPVRERSAVFIRQQGGD
jgi:hypothetical protein